MPAEQQQRQQVAGQLIAASLTGRVHFRTLDIPLCCEPLAFLLMNPSFHSILIFHVGSCIIFDRALSAHQWLDKVEGGRRKNKTHVVDQIRVAVLHTPAEQQRLQPISEDAERLYKWRALVVTPPDWGAEPWLQWGFGSYDCYYCFNNRDISFHIS